MFSGITRGLFEVVELEKQPGLVTYTIKLNDQLTNSLELGASIAINGVCQTVMRIHNHEVTFQAMQETLDKTTLKYLHLGEKVSVERSVRYGDEIGGHEVSGHVIGTATVEEIQASENNLTIVFGCSENWMKYIIPKGFIAIDGSSLTVAKTQASGLFSVHFIPETLKLTNFANKNSGDEVNIEVDTKTRLIVDTTENFLQQRFLSN